MLQKITAYNTYSETMLYLTCPNCREKNEIGLLRFLAANYSSNPIECVACKKEFTVYVICQTRDAELPLEPTLGQTCPSCGGKGLTGTKNLHTCVMCDGTGQV